MNGYSTREVAKQLGLHYISLQRHISAGKIPAPKVVKIGGVSTRVWSEQDVDLARRTLPKIANGRKTRWQRQHARSKKKGAVAKKK